MTNYNERLDEIHTNLVVSVYQAMQEGSDDTEARDKAYVEAKQAITSLIKEMVDEVIGTNEVTLTNIYANNWRNNYGYNETQVRDAAKHLQRKQRQRLANLLKALEEV